MLYFCAPGRTAKWLDGKAMWQNGNVAKRRNCKAARWQNDHKVKQQHFAPLRTVSGVLGMETRIILGIQK